jgi:hypothetical protein
VTTGPENPYGGNADDQPPAPSWGQQPGSEQPPVYGQQPAYGQPPYGAPQYPVHPAYLAAPQSDGLAVGAMVTGIASMVLACAYGVGLLGSPVALVLGRVSLKRIDASQGQLGGRSMAMAGFVLGIIGTVLLLLAIAFVVVVVVAGLNGAFDSP